MCVPIPHTQGMSLPQYPPMCVPTISKLGMPKVCTLIPNVCTHTTYPRYVFTMIPTNVCTRHLQTGHAQGTSLISPPPPSAMVFIGCCFEFNCPCCLSLDSKRTLQQRATCCTLPLLVGEMMCPTLPQTTHNSFSVFRLTANTSQPRVMCPSQAKHRKISCFTREILDPFTRSELGGGSGVTRPKIKMKNLATKAKYFGAAVAMHRGCHLWGGGDIHWGG